MLKKNTEGMSVYRHELKYIINSLEAQQLRKMLQYVLSKDIHSEHRDYYIRSLYFDTIDDKAYVEKILGVGERKKIRLRIYAYDTDKVKLEIKNKYGNYSKKETVLIGREDALQLIRGKSEDLLLLENRTANKVYLNMKQELYLPQIMIDYEREAYYLPIENIRITFDKNIRAARDDRIFEKNIPMVGLMSQENCILEVKYDHYLPSYVKNILASCTMQNSAVSKYTMARAVYM